MRNFNNFLTFQLVFYVTISSGCELDTLSLEYWHKVEHMYNREKYPDNMNSAVTSMNTETYKTFFKFCSCKYDIFLKNETICKYIFLRSFRSSLRKPKMNNKPRRKMKHSANSIKMTEAYQVISNLSVHNEPPEDDISLKTRPECPIVVKGWFLRGLTCFLLLTGRWLILEPIEPSFFASWIKASYKSL